jgi:two-component system cell cycle sensor histidine kinase/response regulator CckA
MRLLPSQPGPRTLASVATSGGSSGRPVQPAATRPLRLLLVEDCADDAWLLQRTLERGGFRPHMLRVQDEEGARGALRGGTWDLVIVDQSMPGCNGLDVVEIVRHHDLDLPCLLVSGAVSDETAVAAMRAGANDYLMKQNLARLVPVVERELREAMGRRQRRRTEQALAASEERLRLILEQSPDAIASFDEHGRVCEWNAQAVTLFGVPRSEALGHPFHELALAPAWHESFLTALADRFHGPRLAFALRRHCEIEGRHRDGRPVPLDAMVLPVPSSSGLSFCVFLRDLTERRAADAVRSSLELQLRQSQKMEAVGKLAGGIAHDFNNLLTVIQGQGLLLESGLLPDEERPAAIAAIVQAAEKAAELTRQLLTFSRRGTARLAPADLNGIVLDLGKLLRRLIGADIELQTHLAPGLVGVEADTSMMEQVLMNLAVNARDAMPSGGSLVVSTAIVQARPPAAAVAAGCGQGPFARLTVHDTGTGISAELLPHIFEPFFTTKDTTRSSGLGLATVFGIVEQHRGWIDVESRPGEGTTFHVYLPHLADLSLPPDVDTSQALLPRGHECILVVEDETAVREMVRDVLARQGFEVYDAGSGREALELWAAIGDRVDLVLTDIMMPGGMTGLDLVARLRVRRPGLKAIFMSGYRSESNAEAIALDEGINYLSKPYRPAALVRLVRERLDADRDDAPDGNA